MRVLFDEIGEKLLWSMIPGVGVREWGISVRN